MNTAALITGLITAAISLLGFYFKWRMSEAEKHKRNFERSEEKAKLFEESLKINYENYKKKYDELVEILSDDIDDDCASELLSNGAQFSDKIPDPKASKK